MVLLSLCCGCHGGGGELRNPFARGSRDTVLLGRRTLDPNVPLTAVPVRSTRGSDASGLGLTYLRRGDYGRAADAFDQASDLNPEDHNSVFLAGLSYERLGDQNEACRRYAQAARIHPRAEYLDGEARACGGGDQG